MTEEEEEKGSRNVDRVMGRKRQLEEHHFGSQQEHFEDSAVISPQPRESGQALAAKIGGGLGTRKERDLVLGVSIDSGTFDASLMADQSMISRKSKYKKKQKEDLDGSRLYREHDETQPLDDNEPRQRNLTKQSQ